MQLGAFSISLSVKDLVASRDFYEKLGFTKFGGSEQQHYLIMKNGDALIGLFAGMFDQNILTFNPGWDQEAQPLEHFQDVRAIQRALRVHGLEIIDAADEHGEGADSFVVVDPDGNTILIDQHVPKPG